MKFNLFERILLLVIVVLLSVTMIFSLVRKSQLIDSADNQVYSFFSSLKYTFIDRPYQSLIGWVKDYATYHQIREENDQLRKDIDTLNLYKSELMQAHREIDELRALLELETALSRYELIHATVIGRDLSSWSNTIKIDVGTADGVDGDYAVITPKGLIGRISSTNEHSSMVKLITTEDGQNKVSVIVQLSADKTAQAYLESYDKEKQAFIVKLLSTGHTVLPGMTVMTSGMGGVFPSGLLVGSVIEVTELENAVGTNVYVHPAADFDSFNYVSIVKLLGKAS